MTRQRLSVNRARARIFRALSDPARLEMIEFLREGEKCVCEIAPHVDLVQSLVSRHLKILKDFGVLKYRKEGNRRLYSVTEPRIFELVDAASPGLIEALSRRMVEQMV